MAIKSAIDVSYNTELFKGMIVGDYGTGKSVFAASFPTPGFVFDFDKGIITYGKNACGGEWDYAQYDLSPLGWTLFEKELAEVEKLVKEEKYQTVVVDSTSIMSSLAMEKALQLDPKRSPTNGPLWNVHYGMVRNLVEGKLRKMLNWKCNLLILSHLEVLTDKESGAIIKIQPLLPGALSDLLPGYFDEVYVAACTAVGGVQKYQIQTATRGFYKARSRASGKEGRLPMYIDHTNKNGYEELMRMLEEGKKKPAATVSPNLKK
jgi:hypothetical protein